MQAGHGPARPGDTIVADADLHALIDKAYEAALDPEQWVEFSKLLQAAFASPMAGLFVQNKWSGEFRRATLLGMPPAYEASYNEHYAAINPWFQAGLIRADLTIVETSLDEHLNRPGAYYETEFYNDWVKPMGLKHSMGGAVKTHGSDMVTFTVFRPAETGPFQQRELRLYETLRPHLARAVDISGRLEDLQWQIHAHARLQDRLPIGLVLLDASGTIIEANARAEAYLAEGGPLYVREQALASKAPRDNDRLQKLIRDALGVLTGDIPAEPALVAIPRADGKPTLSITAIPLPRDRPLFAERTAAAAVFLSSSEDRASLRRDRLEARYGLTRAEAWLTAQLVTQGNLKQAARVTGVSYETARGYLKSILRKTHTHSQTELLGRLLSDWGLLVGDDEPGDTTRMTE